MGHVIDVDDHDGEPAVLTQTTAGGLFGGTLLHDEPLIAHLTDEERPQYVLRNKKRGLWTDSDGEREQCTPDDSCQALAVVTDVRIVVVVGQTGGDVVTTIPLLDVLDANVTDGLVSSELHVATDAGTSYEFACRGDLSPVAEYVDGTAQAWVRAYRLLDDATDRLDRAERHLEDESFSAALDAVEDAATDVQTARDRLAVVGDGALAWFDEDSESTRTRARELPRTIHDARARHAQAVARSHWRDGEYEQAHDQYDIAIQAYREATRSAGEGPPDDELDQQRATAQAQLAELQRAPLARAQQVAQGAISIDGPAPAAARWEAAIERYQEALWLDWGREERRFDGDPEPIREFIVDAVDNLVTERRAAARACREAARDHRMAGSPDAARAAYRTALDHVECAQAVVSEVAPNRETGLEDTVNAIEEAMAGVDGGPDADEMDQPTTDAAPSGRQGLADVVADHWYDHGWMVERTDGHLLATCEEPVAIRAVVRILDQRPSATGGSTTEDEWFEERDDVAPTTPPDAAVEQVGPAKRAHEETVVAIEECRELSSTNDATLAVVVTTETPPPAARDLAAEHDVRLLELEQLLDGHAPSRTDTNEV